MEVQPKDHHRLLFFCPKITPPPPPSENENRKIILKNKIVVQGLSIFIPSYFHIQYSIPVCRVGQTTFIKIRDLIH
jgi:hypothetical protein